ncbi:hypothetical protein JB92DRAFT_1280131 [Gautieria morchelliformis]|nr:hypothetical protein JB92DRAFT_1280131 [Gautieria morchelliformis]
MSVYRLSITPPPCFKAVSHGVVTVIFSNLVLHQQLHRPQCTGATYSPSFFLTRLAYHSESSLPQCASRSVSNHPTTSSTRRCHVVLLVPLPPPAQPEQLHRLRTTVRRAPAVRLVTITHCRLNTLLALITVHPPLSSEASDQSVTKYPSRACLLRSLQRVMGRPSVHYCWRAMSVLYGQAGRPDPSSVVGSLAFTVYRVDKCPPDNITK